MYQEGSILLRPMEENDLNASLKWINDPELALLVNRFSPVAFENHLQWYKKNISDPTKVMFAIDNVTMKKYIGNCALINIDHRNQKAELWIYLDKQARGNQCGKDTLTALLRYGFEKLNLNRIYLYVMDYNKPAVEFYKKLGFSTEGIFREDYFMDGKFCDTVHMSILRREFNVNKQVK